MATSQDTPVVNDSTATWLWIAVIVIVLLVRFGGCSSVVIGQPPPYAATKPTVLIVEDESPEGRRKLTGEQDDIMRSLLPEGVRKSVEAAGGEFQVIGHNNSVDFETDWMKAAWQVADKTNLPSIVAASPRAGVKPQPLPKTVADTKTLLAPLGVK